MKEGQDWQFSIPGFRCFRRDREGDKRGGGVALLIRENVTAIQREDTLVGSCNEAIWVKLRYRLGLYYRPPNNQREVEELICQQIMGRCKNSRVVVMGDFNFPNIDWDSFSARGLDEAEFVQCVQECFLRQYVDSPTQEGAILDLVLGNEPG